MMVDSMQQGARSPACNYSAYMSMITSLHIGTRKPKPRLQVLNFEHDKTKLAEDRCPIELFMLKSKGGNRNFHNIINICGGGLLTTYD